MLKGNAIVGQSGGPTAAINATLAGVIRGAAESEAIGTLYGAFNGVEGMLANRICNLSELLKNESDLRLLENTPAAALGSCRLKLKNPSDESAASTYESLISFFKKYDIRYFFYIGGNDSMDTVAKLTAYLSDKDWEMRIMGVPKTIDNDVVDTDHTPGYGSAAKYIAATMQEILRDTAVYTVKAVTIVEIMGRDAGWLTAASALTRKICGVSPDLIYLPERIFDYTRFFEDIRKALERRPNVVVAVSEGLRLADGTYVGESAQSGTVDAFGHKYLSGTGKALEIAVKEEIGCKVRSVELNIMQRCASHIASKTDLTESVAVGRAAVRAAERGESGKMMRFVRRPGDVYQVDINCEDIAKIANKIRKVPDEFITSEGNNITDAGIDYLLPLIQGEPDIVFENGLPKHFVINR
jgi:6-phosphofructokinase